MVGRVATDTHLKMGGILFVVDGARGATRPYRAIYEMASKLAS
jgi:hypothetical protein